MPLQQLGLNASLSWLLSETVNYGSTVSSNDSFTFNLNGAPVATWDQLFCNKYSIAPSSTQGIDLTSLTNVICEDVTFTKILCMGIKPVGMSVTVAPDAVDGFVWGFGADDQSWTIPDGGLFFVSEPKTGGAVVDSTHKILNLTNASGETGLVFVAIAGSTAEPE